VRPSLGRRIEDDPVDGGDNVDPVGDDTGDTTNAAGNFGVDPAFDVLDDEDVESDVGGGVKPMACDGGGVANGALLGTAADDDDGNTVVVVGTGVNDTAVDDGVGENDRATLVPLGLAGPFELGLNARGLLGALPF
jgi:hypothetical protein